MPEDFDAGEFSLKACPCTVVEGLIFICLTSSDAPDLAEVAEQLSPFFRLHGIEEATLARREIFPLQANWKLAVENYLECYHCKPAHHEYTRIEIKAEKNGDGSPAALAAWQERFTEWRELAEKQETFLDDYGTPLNPDQALVQIQFGAAYRSPMRTSYQTASKNGRPVSRLMGNFREYDGGETAVGVGPFTFMLAYNDYAAFFQFVPVDEQHSDMIVTWLVHPEAESHPDFDLERLTWLWTVTTHQDQTIIEANARGIGSRFYETGPPSLLEDDLVGFRQWYLAMIGNGDRIASPVRRPNGRYFDFHE